MTMTKLVNEEVKPHILSSARLAHLGVEVLNRFDLHLRCMSCGEVWTPVMQPNGMLPYGYWHCPNKCNL